MNEEATVNETVTIDDVRRRMLAAGVTIPEHRLEMVRRLLADALAAVHAMDSSAMRREEPAVTFDASAGNVD
jgi:hypothetical protein